ncbi:hypothetical protein PT277_02660 [Acetobacteraceae bacterium ESL0709]|nr:hypothetical protein [Acetobacteraceae bacterium ESL0697]MDF7677604.1 hypothetical protein [Acetobacteraceae bacterium ESL0709]
MQRDGEHTAEILFYTLLERENKAFAQLQEAESDFLARYNAASSPEADDSDVEEFGRWLQIGRRNIECARERLAAITLERGLVRQALIAERASKRNIENEES